MKMAAGFAWRLVLPLKCRHVPRAHGTRAHTLITLTFSGNTQQCTETSLSLLLHRWNWKWSQTLNSIRHRSLTPLTACIKEDQSIITSFRSLSLSLPPPPLSLSLLSVHLINFHRSFCWNRWASLIQVIFLVTLL